MKLKANLFVTILLFSVRVFPQDNTAPTTYSSEERKESNVFFSQFVLGVPFNANPNQGKIDPATGETESWLIPDGISLHAGAGIHFKKWIGISANSGIDWRLKQKLVSLPVYGSVIINPHFNKETSIFLQAGLGQAYAIGRGSLSGTYQKYRIGFLFDSLLLFADASLFGYPLKGIEQTGTFTVGISLINF